MQAKEHPPRGIHGAIQRGHPGRKDIDRMKYQIAYQNGFESHRPHWFTPNQIAHDADTHQGGAENPGHKNTVGVKVYAKHRKKYPRYGQHCQTEGYELYRVNRQEQF